MSFIRRIRRKGPSNAEVVMVVMRDDIHNAVAACKNMPYVLCVHDQFSRILASI